MPPDPLVILDDSGIRRTTFVGPFRENDDVFLICDAVGGFKLKFTIINNLFFYVVYYQGVRIFLKI